MVRAMRRLVVDWVDLEIAFRDATGNDSYLDLDSGEVMTIMKGFDDELELREKLRKHPKRYLKLPTVDAAFTRTVLHTFIARMPPSPLQKKLAECEPGPGGIARAMQQLKNDKPAFASYSRFEQSELWTIVEQFLADHAIEPTSPPPAVELFE
jgi:hypothetical protein